MAGESLRCARLPLPLNLDVHIHQRQRGGRDPGNAAGLADRGGADAGKLLLHLAGKTADRAVVEPGGDVALLSLLELVDGLLLLVKIAGVLNLDRKSVV